MFYVYLIESTIKKWVYVGFCKELENRLKQHNNGYVSSTRSYRPFKLLFVQIVHFREQARDLEKFLKIRYNKETLIKLLVKD